MFEEQAHAPFSQRWALIILTVSIILLSLRYHTTVSFERPAHLTIITLILTGLSFASIARWQRNSGPSLSIFWDEESSHPPAHHDNARRTSGTLRHKNPAIRLLSSVLDKARRLHRSFYLLIACVSARTWLTWAITRTTQCSRGGLEAFLPFLTLVFEAVGPLGISPPDLQPHEFVGHHSSRLRRLSWPSRSHLVYAFLSLAWPALVVLAMDRSEIATGTVCPRDGRWEALVPYMQLIKCGLDAVVITHCAHLIRNAVDDELDIVEFMGTLSFTAGGCLLLFSLPAWLEASDFVMPLRWLSADVRDMILDGALMASATVCATNLLSVLHSSAFALFISSVGFVALQADQLGATAYLSPSRYTVAAERMTLVMTVAAPLLYLTRQLPNVSKSFVHPSIHKWLIMAYAAVVSLSVVCWLWMSVRAGPSDLELNVAVEKLVSDAGADTGRWEAQASRSKTLAEAAAEYQRRYRIRPPPNFDRWYEFASDHKSPIIDDYGQIFDDLLPFWGEEPASIRAKTAELLSQNGSGVGALRIRNGTLQLMPDTPKSEAGVMETFGDMLGPFVKWLPDMDLAINLDGESRVAVHFKEMQRIKARALRNLASAGNSKGVLSWSEARPTEAPWRSDPGEHASTSRRRRADFLGLKPVNSHVFHDWIAPTCSSKTAARVSRWWDWAVTCADCSRSHSTETSSGPLLDDVSRALDLCHQPDMAYLDSFDVSSRGALLTHKLLPIFSQGRLGSFSDILIPSARDFAGETVPDESAWSQKKNTMFWRGSGASHSSATNGRWAGFLRWRFVNEAQSEAAAARGFLSRLAFPSSSSSSSWSSSSPLSSSTTQAVAINVSFTSEKVVNLCDGRACEPLLWNSAMASLGATQASVSLEEHWRYRHLVDLEEGGAGGNGFFLALLRSQSLPYRVVRRRTWYSERVQAWHHYVPVDMRLGRGLWAVLELLGSNRAGERPRWGHGRHRGAAAAVSTSARDGRSWSGDIGGGNRTRTTSTGMSTSTSTGASTGTSTGTSATGASSRRDREHLGAIAVAGSMDVQVEDAAEKMARQGREWAGKALRREDMQIYMFRLLLEWGRVIDDERERLGFLVG